MNFVIFARNFYPQNDPEAFCSTRFASALAKNGHSVHVVTAEYSNSANDYAKLVHSSIRITRVQAPLEDINITGRISTLKYVNPFRKMIYERDRRNLGAFVKATKKVLSLYDNPILITRAYPMMSLYVGYYCRKHAFKWVSHLSDPIPWKIEGSIMSRLQALCIRHWIKRSFKAANLVSLTCSRAIRWYKEKYGDVVDVKKCIVTTHIGDMKLSADRKENMRVSGAIPIILHSGGMYWGRGELILDAIEALNANGITCQFVQDRKVDAVLAESFKRYPHATLLNGERRVSESIALMESATAVFVADFNSELGYSPFLMSKFVYQIFGDKPIVVYAKRNSEKYDLCARYPEAGLFFAEQGSLDSLKNAICKAINCDTNCINRVGIRREFEEDTIAQKFVTSCIEKF